MMKEKLVKLCKVQLYWADQIVACKYVSLEHKSSHKCQIFEIEIYTSSEFWINKRSIDVWFVMIGQYLNIWNLRVQKNRNIEKIIFKVV